MNLRNPDISRKNIQKIDEARNPCCDIDIKLRQHDDRYYRLPTLNVNDDSFKITLIDESNQDLLEKL